MKFQASSLFLTVQISLCHTWLETPKSGFLCHGPYVCVNYFFTEIFHVLIFQDRVSDLERYVEALKQENSSLLAGDGTNRSIDSSGSSIRRVCCMLLV